MRFRSLCCKGEKGSGDRRLHNLDFIYLTTSLTSMTAHSWPFLCSAAPPGHQGLAHCVARRNTPLHLYRNHSTLSQCEKIPPPFTRLMHSCPQTKHLPHGGSHGPIPNTNVHHDREEEEARNTRKARAGSSSCSVRLLVGVGVSRLSR